MSEFFKRIERKYLIDQEQYKDLNEIIQKYMIEDFHGKSKICNVYFDTNNYDLIRNSIDSQIYKDKIRIRSYNTPTESTPIYLEIKRKSEGIVSKRRIQCSIKEVENFIKTGEIKNINQGDEQVAKELKYYFDLYNLKPTAYVSYDRNAYYEKEDNQFRITIDSNIIARNYDLCLEKGSYGKRILEKNLYLLEVKTTEKIPLWFVKTLSKENIKPAGFSKYGELYKQLILKVKVA